MFEKGMKRAKRTDIKWEREREGESYSKGKFQIQKISKVNHVCIKINVAMKKTTYKTNILKNCYSTWDKHAHNVY